MAVQAVSSVLDAWPTVALAKAASWVASSLRANASSMRGVLSRRCSVSMIEGRRFLGGVLCVMVFLSLPELVKVVLVKVLFGDEIWGLKKPNVCDVRLGVAVFVRGVSSIPLIFPLAKP